VTLVEAFRQCGPLIEEDSDGVRAQASRVLFEEIQRLSHFLPVAVRDDAVQKVFLRVFRVGPRGIRDSDPDTESGVRGYLARSLRNVLKDEQRAHARIADTEPPEQSVDPVPIEDRWLTDAIDGARQTLNEICIPRCAESLRTDARPIFDRVISDRRAMTNGQLTLDDVVIRSRGELTRVNRNAVHQEQSRALKRLGEFMEHYISAQQLTQVEAHALRVVFGELSGLEN
jgi:DNA-directed RNA polymerase specialized sigma24 family protein